MTTNTIFLVWKDDNIRSIFTSIEAADAFVATHFSKQDGVWISERDLHDVTPEEVTTPEEAYVISYATEETRDLMARLFGLETLAPPVLESAMKVKASTFDNAIYQLDGDMVETLHQNKAVIIDTPQGGFEVIAKDPEVAKDAYMNRLAEMECLAQTVDA